MTLAVLCFFLFFLFLKQYMDLFRLVASAPRLLETCTLLEENPVNVQGLSSGTDTNALQLAMSSALVNKHVFSFLFTFIVIFQWLKCNGSSLLQEMRWWEGGGGGWRDNSSSTGQLVLAGSCQIINFYPLLSPRNPNQTLCFFCFFWLLLIE